MFDKKLKLKVNQLKRKIDFLEIDIDSHERRIKWLQKEADKQHEKMDLLLNHLNLKCGFTPGAGVLIEKTNKPEENT